MIRDTRIVLPSFFVIFPDERSDSHRAYLPAPGMPCIYSVLYDGFRESSQCKKLGSFRIQSPDGEKRCSEARC